MSIFLNLRDFTTRNKEEWNCFLEELTRALDARENSSKYIIMSDRHEVCALIFFVK